MKIFITGICLLFIAAAYGQATASYGVYLTAGDYLAHKLTMPFDKNDGKHYKLKQTVSPEILIKTPEKSYPYAFNNIWGYRENGTDWRVANGTAYRVMYTGKAYVYMRPASAGDAYKTERTDTKAFYFSKDAASRVRYLVRANLKEVYADDTAFVAKVNGYPMLASISKWDKEKGCYTFINWLK